METIFFSKGEGENHHECQCHYLGEQEEIKGTSSAIANKAITKILLPQERDANKSIADADKPITTSNVVNKV